MWRNGLSPPPEVRATPSVPNPPNEKREPSILALALPQAIPAIPIIADSANGPIEHRTFPTLPRKTERIENDLYIYEGLPQIPVWQGVRNRKFKRVKP
jgi:hypothetical protein